MGTTPLPAGSGAGAQCDHVNVSSAEYNAACASSAAVDDFFSDSVRHLVLTPDILLASLQTV